MVATWGWKGTCTKLSYVSLACQIAARCFLTNPLFLELFCNLHTSINSHSHKWNSKLYGVTKLKSIGMFITTTGFHCYHIRQLWNLLPVCGEISVLAVWTSRKSGLQEQPVSKNSCEVSSWEVNWAWDIQSIIHKEGRKFNIFMPSKINY